MKLLAILTLIMIIWLVLILSRVSNIDNNMVRFCKTDNSLLLKPWGQ